MTAEPLAPSETGVADYKRDRYGRPLIVPAGGGKALPYTRSSGAAKEITDTFNLTKWQLRNVAYGMTADPSLTARCAAVGGDPASWDRDAKREIDKIAEAAQAAAKAHRAADIGTALHRMTEQFDRGERTEFGQFEPDVTAYQEALNAAGIVTTEHIECRMVCDILELAGTADRIVTGPDGVHRIADIKTGTSVDYGALEYAAQLAAYAHSTLYDPATDTRVPTPTIDGETGYIIHLPAGTGTCTIYTIDLTGGWEAAKLAYDVRAIRKAARRWLAPLETAATQQPVDAESPNDRRERLLAWYGRLSEADQAAFVALNVPRDDLDAIEAALRTVDPFASTRTEPEQFDLFSANPAA